MCGPYVIMIESDGLTTRLVETAERTIRGIYILSRQPGTEVSVVPFEEYGRFTMKADEADRRDWYRGLIDNSIAATGD